MSWLRLIRWKNLAIILLTQLLVWWSLVLPEDPEVLKPVHFAYIVLSTLLIAAAGYIINDYFDIKIDLINKPDKVVLEKVIPRKHAIIAHALLNATAVSLAGIVAAKAHHLEWLLLQLACIALLWFYSTHFKRQYITGNIAISLLTALTILIFIVYEPALRDEFSLPMLSAAGWHSGSSLPFWTLLVYAYFAFMLTWMREIVKDMEDYQGDESEGCKTLPIKRGLKYATGFTTALALLVVIPLAAACGLLYHYKYVLLPLFIVVFLIVPIVIWSFFLNKNTTKRHYHTSSRMLKLIMLLGICSLLIYHLELYANLIEE
jgi:4-hydroxybenzoate polyprenyltransferase